MDRHLSLTTPPPIGGGMTSHEHAMQRSALRASLLTDSVRFTHHDVYPLRPGPVAAAAAPSSAAKAG